jgi:DNA-binding IclR family transcriptional regulator
MPTRSQIDLVGKTMRVLEVLAESGESVSLKEIAGRVDLVKSSAFRILYSLEKLGYVEHAEGKGAYRVTWKIVGLGRRSAARATLASVAKPHLVRLRDELWESAWLAEWRANAIVLIDVVEAARPLRLSLDVGSDCPLHATAVGKAIAAHLPPRTLRAALGSGNLPRFTPRTITSRAKLQAELEKVRRQGFALNNEETVTGSVLVGAPVFDSALRVAAGVSVSIPTPRWSAEKQEKTIRAVMRGAAAIGADLAHVGFLAKESGATPAPA